MPSPTENQNRAISLMDFLYFHDLASLSTFSVPKNEFLLKLKKSVDDLTFARGHRDRDFCVYKHFILCSIEILAGTPQPSEVNDYDELVMAADTLLEKVEFDVKKYGFSVEEFCADIKALDEIYYFSTVDKVLVYKLVAQYLYFEYDLSSIAVFNKFLELGILKSSRYVAKNAENKKDIFNVIFFRSMLFIEFEINKKQLYFNKYKRLDLTIDFSKSEEKINDMLLFAKSIKQVQSQTGENYQSIVDIDLSSKKNIEKYINEINIRLVHNRLFLKNISQCVGLVGNWFVNFYKETKIDRPIHAEPLNKDEQEKKVCTVEAQDELFNHGFTLYDPRTLNDHYNDFCLDYRLIREYYRNFSEDHIGIMTPDIINYYFIAKNEGIYFSPLY